MTSRTRARTPLAALTAAVLALSGCSGDSASDAAPTADPTRSPTADATAAPDPTTSAPPTGDAGSPSTAGETALAFVRAVSEGDEEAAFALLAPSSQDAVGGRQGFGEQSSGLAEGFGAFADADPQVLRTAVGEGTGVVTLAAEVTREGMTENAAVTLPYREQDGRVALDLFDRSDAQLEVRTPEPGGPLAPGGELVVSIPGGLEPVVNLDGQQLGFEQVTEGDAQQLRTVAPRRLDPAAEHVLTVAWTDEDGRLGGDAVVFPAG